MSRYDTTVYSTRHAASIATTTGVQQRGQSSATLRMEHIMARQRTSSYSSSTLSSTSSDSSSGTYASIKSISSYASRLSLQIRSTDFWNQFERNSRKRQSVSSVFKQMFSKRRRGEPEKNIPQLSHSSTYLSSPLPVTSEHSLSRLSSSAETSFIEKPEHLPSPVTMTPGVPAGLYCVIEDFLTEYDLRLLEEEERAEMIARKSKEIN